MSIETDLDRRVTVLESKVENHDDVHDELKEVVDDVRKMSINMAVLNHQQVNLTSQVNASISDSKETNKKVMQLIVDSAKKNVITSIVSCIGAAIITALVSYFITSFLG